MKLAMTTYTKRNPKALIAVSCFTLAAGISTATADQVFIDDIIVGGSACIGFDCVNGESFGFDTIRLKENNLRIKFVDTSSSASFPTNDWQLTANETSNGGANKFSIDDVNSGRTPFTIEAGAPSHSLYVDERGTDWSGYQYTCGRYSFEVGEYPHHAPGAGWLLWVLSADLGRRG